MLNNSIVHPETNQLANLLTLINVPKIDSLSLKIPLNDCEILDKRLTSTTSIYYTDYDVVDYDNVLPPKPLIIDNGRGVKIRLRIQILQIYNKETRNRVETRFIDCTVPAKLLKQFYFFGISSQTVKMLYDSFIQMNVFKCSYDTFLDAVATDVDICKDVYCFSLNSYRDALNTIYNMCGTKQKYIEPFDDKTSAALVFNSREGAKPTLPHIKFYHKSLELYNRSADFWNTYLFPAWGNFVKNLTRIECTVKNYKHKERLEKHKVMPMFKTFRELLEIPLENLNKFIEYSVKSYTETVARIRAPDLSPTDHIIFELLQNCINKGFSETVLLSLVDSFKLSTEGATKNARSRMRKKIKDLIELLYQKDLKIYQKQQHNEHINTYLKYLNLSI